MDTADKDRRTGRTTRQLASCMERAKAGEHVLFVVPTLAMARHCLGLAEEHGPRAMTIEHQNKRLGFPGGGFVLIVTGDEINGDRMRGQSAKVEIDHATELDYESLMAIGSIEKSWSRACWGAKG